MASESLRAFPCKVEDYYVLEKSDMERFSVEEHSGNNIATCYEPANHRSR